MKMYIMTHKDCVLPRSRMYCTVGLGGYAGPTVDVTDLSVAGSISGLNKYYCELTGIHSAWQQSLEDIIGVCHYRRYFSLVPISIDGVITRGWINTSWSKEVLDFLQLDVHENKIYELLGQYDIIVPRAVYASSGIGGEYLKAHPGVTWELFVENLDTLYGASRHSVRIDDRQFYCNMFIMSRGLFNLYCSELFSIIDKVFQRVRDVGPHLLDDQSPARFQTHRFPGYLGERFMTAFLNAHKLKYYEADVLVIN
jgi:hypothetical protein